MWIKDCGEEQQQHGAVNDKCEGVVKVVVEGEQHETKADGRANPHDLHARTRAETKYVGVAVGVAGTANAHPSEGEEREVDANRPPI